MTSTPLSKKALLALKRFPLVFLIALIGTFATIVFINLLDHYRDLIRADPGRFAGASEMLKTLGTLSAVSVLGISLLLSLKLFAENALKQSKVGQWVLQFLGLALLFAYFFRIRSVLELSSDGLFKKTVSLEWFAIEYFVLSIILHLFVAFAGFLKRRKTEDLSFWRFNKNLFVNLQFALLCSGTLFAGLSFAIFSVSFLLTFQIPKTFYFQLYFFIIGFLNTAFFLSMVPSVDQNEAPFDPEKDYPRSVKVFTRWILTPLLGLYLPILYLYAFQLFKRLTSSDPHPLFVQWQWLEILDEGTFVVMVSLYSAFGLLCHLLLDPIEKTEEKGRKIRMFSKIYFASVIPLLGMLFWILIRLILRKGFLFPFYYTGLGALWMIGVCIYWLVIKKRNLVWIPLSLAVLLILSLIGPLSARKLSYSILHAYSQRFTQSQSGHPLLQSEPPSLLLKRTWSFSPDHSWINCWTGVTEIHRADLLVQGLWYSAFDVGRREDALMKSSFNFIFQKTPYRIWVEKPGVFLISKKDTSDELVAKIDWTEGLKKLKDKKQSEEMYFLGNLPSEDLHFYFENEKVKVEAFFDTLNLSETKGVVTIEKLEPDLLITFK